MTKQDVLQHWLRTNVKRQFWREKFVSAFLFSTSGRPSRRRRLHRRRFLPSRDGDVQCDRERFDKKYGSCIRIKMFCSIASKFPEPDMAKPIKDLSERSHRVLFNHRRTFIRLNSTTLLRR